MVQKIQSCFTTKTLYVKILHYILGFKLSTIVSIGILLCAQKWGPILALGVSERYQDFDRLSIRLKHNNIWSSESQ